MQEEIAYITDELSNNVTTTVQKQDGISVQTDYEILVVDESKVPGLVNPLLRKMMLPYNYKGMLKILKEYMDAGKGGQAFGEGFYKYK